MSDLLAARSQMAISLGFHIIFAAIGIAMPFLMAVAHWRWLKTKEQVYYDLTKIWSRGVAIFFAVGAVSGTVLSFELGLLWPKFMLHAGAIIGMPFSWEGAAFFIEAIFIGIFLYAEGRINPWLHWMSGVVVGISGVLSGFFVICANAWMNSPAGFDWVDNEAKNIDPWAAMFNRMAWPEGLHMTIAAFAATGFAVAGLHALALVRDPNSKLHRRALEIALVVGALGAIIQPIQGDLLGKKVAELQPVKLAAMEALFKTTKSAGLLIGGFPSEKEEKVYDGFRIPKMLSFLAHEDFNSEVEGLDDFPRSDWPKVAVTHIAFQIMVATGSFLALVGVIGIVAVWRKKSLLTNPFFLKVVAVCTPLGFVAIEAGWTVTEVGRQPWIIYKVMRTADAVTPMPGLVVPMLFFTAVYLFLSAAVVWLMARQFKHAT